jgi:hypothetical protein
MVCILKSAYKGDDLDFMMDRFKHAFAALKRPASVPIEALLLDYDSPLLKPTTKQDEGRKKRATISWEKCRVGHHDYSLKWGLGEKRPITNWQASGAKVLPDWHQPMDGLTERTMDTMDISHLRNVRYKEIDDRYQK